MYFIPHLCFSTIVAIEFYPYILLNAHTSIVSQYSSERKKKKQKIVLDSENCMKLFILMCQSTGYVMHWLQLTVQLMIIIYSVLASTHRFIYMKISMRSFFLCLAAIPRHSFFTCHTINERSLVHSGTFSTSIAIHYSYMFLLNEKKLREIKLKKRKALHFTLANRYINRVYRTI